MLTLIFIIIAISILILGHEWGHFFVSRKLGMRVEEFGLGFPPRLISRMKNGVRYSINLLLFGGFVKIFGEHGEGAEDSQSFASRPAWQRVVVLGAGVGMNLALAWVMFSAGAAIGVPRASDSVNQIPVSIIAVMPDSPAQKAGLKMGDQILEIRTTDVSLRIESEDDVRNFVGAYLGEEITLVAKRGSGDIHEIKITPRVSAPNGEGALGIAMARLEIIRTPWYLAPIEGLNVLARSAIAIFQGFAFIVKELALGNIQSLAVSGPVGIYRYAHETQQFGFAYFLQFVGIVSVNLAVLNALPIPALDGGRILFVILEKIQRKRVDPELENKIHAAGFAVLVLLLVVVTYRDIAQVW